MLRTLVTRRLPAALLPGLAGGGSWAAAAAVNALHGSALAAASVQVKIPALGESISDGTVAAVLKQAGDRVEEDEPILQIETDKVTVDVRAPQAGVLEAILVGAPWWGDPGPAQLPLPAARQQQRQPGTHA